jgi:hypothetical protein
MIDLAPNVKIFKHGEVQCILVKEPNGWHLSMSTKSRLPTYDEMKEIRYQYVPDDVYMAQIFPPKKEFVNVHPYTLHLYQIQP